MPTRISATKFAALVTTKNATVRRAICAVGIPDSRSADRASYELPHGVTFAGTASAGRTRTAGQDQAMGSVGDVMSSAWAVTFAKEGVVGKKDLFKVSLTQPLRIDRFKTQRPFDSIFNNISVLPFAA